MASATASHPAPPAKARRLSAVFTHRRISEGIAATILSDIVDAGILSRGELARVIPARTLARRMSTKAALATAEADAIGRLVRIASQANRTFGDADFARRWLRAANPALDDRIPLEMAETDAGAREVEAVLDRIAYGDYA